MVREKMVGIVCEGGWSFGYELEGVVSKRFIRHDSIR